MAQAHKRSETRTAAAEIAADSAAPAVDKASSVFEGRWARLVSTSNWHKGRIIYEWRLVLKESEAPAAEYSDEAWSRRVGGVTGQHVGRLRRVYERFGDSQEQYAGLFWSHFQAALDWEDAEMWLEGAIQSSWSVSSMRKARWEAMGAPAELKPRDEDIITTEINEDLDAREGSSPDRVEAAYDEARSPAGPDFGDENDWEEKVPGSAASGMGDSRHAGDTEGLPAETVAIFKDLPHLPDDISEAFEAFKLAILRHKADNWTAVRREDVLSCLDGLKQLAISVPTFDNATT